MFSRKLSIGLVLLPFSSMLAQEKTSEIPSPLLIATEDGKPGAGWGSYLKDTEDEIADAANRELDVIYGRKDGMALVMDVYAPKTDANGKAIIFVVSGGYWSGPDYRRMQYCTDCIRTLLENGFTVFAVQHRSIPRFTVAEMSADISRSIRFVRHHADEYSIESDSIGLFGTSSGGHLALLAATTGTKDTHESSSDPVERQSSSVAAVVAIHPPTDLLNFGEKNRLISTHLRELGFANDGAWDFRAFDKTQGKFSPLNAVATLEMLRTLSPIYQVTPDDPPALLVHGDKDENVPLSQSKRFVDRMTALERQADLHIVEGKGHVPFEGIDQVFVSFFKKHL